MLIAFADEGDAGGGTKVAELDVDLAVIGGGFGNGGIGRAEAGHDAGGRDEETLQLNAGRAADLGGGGALPKEKVAGRQVTDGDLAIGDGELVEVVADGFVVEGFQQGDVDGIGGGGRCGQWQVNLRVGGDLEMRGAVEAARVAVELALRDAGAGCC